jgi:IclR family transcriptional regulator, pca regulon regulatory protein
VPTEKSRYRVEALAKGLRVLREFTEQRPRLKLGELAGRTNIPVPTLFRLLSTLEEEGFVERLPSGEYQPDVAILTLGFATLQGMDLVQAASGPLLALAESTGETVNLGTLSGDRVLYLQRLRNSDLVTASIQVGSTLPAAYASMGKLMLAQLDEAELAARLGPDSFPGGAGPNAVGSRTALAKQLKQIRTTGYAIQDEEVAHGLRSIAAGVRDGTGNVVAAANIAVRAADYDLERIISELKTPLFDTCDRISLRLGHRTSAAAAVAP